MLKGSILSCHCTIEILEFLEKEGGFISEVYDQCK